MSIESPRQLGLQQLETIISKKDEIKHWKTWLTEYQVNTRFPDDSHVWLTCILALKAVNFGNFGIGCILVNKKGDVVTLGHNEVFYPYFRSDRHAEMVVMDEFEDANPKNTTMKGYTLYTSLESCPMCLARLITSGVGTVLCAASDTEGGMAHKIKDLPPIWISLASRCVFDTARCSQELIDAAFQIFQLNSSELDEKLMKRRV
ncbi:MAG: nucleoside deaminase [Dehalococcoidales bacterium]